MHPWQPALHTMSVLTRYPPQPLYPPQPSAGAFTRVGANGDPPPTPEQRAQQKQLFAEWREGFKQITPALILTGIAIGIASGAGSTIGAAIGTYLLQRFSPGRRDRR